jgi:hypothetical protein
MRTARLGAAGAIALALATSLASAPEAQDTPAEERCLAIMSIVSGIVDEYHGRISSDLIADLQKKIGTEGKCDGPDEYRVWPNMKDREALGRIRSLISAWDACKRDPAQEACK